jgi:hypothetical protein
MGLGKAQPAVTAAPAWTPEELEGFAGELSDALVKTHLRRDASAFKGMLYEYAMPATGQQGYGRAWDGLRNGAWLGSAAILAYRANRGKVYLDLARQWILPFYLRVLAGSDKLFPLRDKAFSDGTPIPPDRAGPARGFVPLWWDDGTGVSFDALAERRTLDELLGPDQGYTNLLRLRSARDGKVAGYSHGTSEGITDTLALFLANTWLVTRDPQLAGGVRLLRACRKKELAGDPPLLALAEAVVSGDSAKATALAAPLNRAPSTPDTPLYRAVVARQRVELPVSLEPLLRGYLAAAAANSVGPGLARRLSLYTWETLALADRWYGAAKRQEGLMPAYQGALSPRWEAGRPRSLAGSSPQTLVGPRAGAEALLACALSLQLLTAFPEAWPEGRTPRTAERQVPPRAAAIARLKRELDKGLLYWRERLKRDGFLPADWPVGGRKPSPSYWGDQTSAAGAYVFLLAACAEYQVFLSGKRDWELAATTWVGK